MDTQKQVVPFEYRATKDDQGFYTDVSSYLSSVHDELNQGPQVFSSSTRKRKLVNNDVTLRSFEEDKFEQQGKQLIKSHEKEKYDQWRAQFIESFRQEKKVYWEDINEEVEQVNLPNTFTGWRTFMINTTPSRGLLFSLSQATIIRLVIYMKKLIGKNTVKHNLNLWMMALLLRLAEVVEYREVYELRQLAKKLALLRGNPDTNDEIRMLCDMVVAVVHEIYGQRDIDVV